jgi:hypothetical protein
MTPLTLSRLRVITLGIGLACGGGDSPGPAEPDNTPVSIAFSAGSYLLSAQGTLALPVVVRRADFTEITDEVAIEWSSSDPSLVAVDANGVVSGSTLGGPVTITAAAGTVSATASVRVVPADITFSLQPSIAVGITMQLSAQARDARGAVIDAGPIEWSSSAPSVADIDQAGVLTILAPGDAVITAGAAGRTRSNGIFTGFTSNYDGIYATLPGGLGPTVQFEVVFGTVGSLSAIVRTPSGCSISLSASVARVPITANGTFSVSIPTAGTPNGGTLSTNVSGTFNLDNGVVNGGVGTILGGPSAPCGGLVVQGGQYTAHRQ